MSADNQQLEINWSSIVRDLLSHFVILMMAALIGLMGAFSFTKMNYHPQYASSATFVAEVKNASSTYAGLTSATKLAAIFKDVMQSDILRQRAAAYMESSSFPGTVRTQVVDATNLFVVTVTSSSPENAFRGMKAVIEVCPEVSEYLFENAVMNVISVPKAPTEPSNAPPYAKNMILGMLVCLLLTGGCITLLSIFRDTIKSERDIRVKLDTTLYGTVVHEKKKTSKKKSSILLTSRTVSAAFRQSFQRIRIKTEYMARKKGYKVFMVTSAGENEGKSTIAANMALSLAQKGKSVLLMDADLRKPAVVKAFDKQSSFNGKEFGEYLLGRETLEDTLFYDKATGLYMLLGTKNYDASPEMLSSEAMKQVLKMARSELDYVIIDTAPMLLTSDAETLAEYVDASLLVIREDVIRTRDLNDLINILNRSGSELLGCIYNDASKVSADRATASEYRSYSQRRDNTAAQV